MSDAAMPVFGTRLPDQTILVQGLFASGHFVMGVAIGDKQFESFCDKIEESYDEPQQCNDPDCEECQAP
jgi:hypothetical protein